MSAKARLLAQSLGIHNLDEEAILSIVTKSAHRVLDAEPGRHLAAYSAPVAPDEKSSRFVKVFAHGTHAVVDAVVSHLETVASARARRVA